MKRSWQQLLYGAVCLGVLGACRPPMSPVLEPCGDAGPESPQLLGSSASDVWLGCQHFDGERGTPTSVPASASPLSWAVAGSGERWLGARALGAGPLVLRLGADGAALSDASSDFDERGDAVVVRSGNGAVYATQQVSGVQSLYVFNENRFAKLDAFLGLGDRIAAVIGRDDVLLASSGALALKHWDGRVLRELPVTSGGVVVNNADGDVWLLRLDAHGGGLARRRHHGAWLEVAIPAAEDEWLGAVALPSGHLGLVYRRAPVELALRTWDGRRLGEPRVPARFTERCGTRGCAPFMALGSLDDGTLVLESAVGPERDAQTGHFLVFLDDSWF